MKERSGPGRPMKDRGKIVRGFVAKAVYGMPITRHLLDRLGDDVRLRRLCGWESSQEIPDEATFSRAFSEFSETQLPVRVHEALVKSAYATELVGHISRDSTAIPVREKVGKKAPEVKQAHEEVKESPRKRGRPRKGEERPKEPRGGKPFEASRKDDTRRNARGFAKRL